MTAHDSKHIINKFYFISIIVLIYFSTLTAQKNSYDLQSAVTHLSYFIASEKFEKLSYTVDQLTLIDTLFNEAVNYYDNDKSEALLALTFATFTFNEMSLTLPFLGIGMDVPLPTVPDSIFNRRLKNLPGNFLADSPLSLNGDKDKLPHFFGSAFLSYNLGFFNFSKFIGILVELFEETFKVQGKVDSRDLTINNFGDLFGKLLRNNKGVYPSRILSFYSILFYKHKFL